MFSHIIDGKVLNVTTKKHGAGQLVLLGDEWIGQIFKLRHGWDVVYRRPTAIGIISGISCKWKCYELLLKYYDRERAGKRI